MKKTLIIAMLCSLSISSALASRANECLRKVDGARASLIAFKDGRGDEAAVHQTAQDATACLDAMEDKGNAKAKADAIAAWKTFREIRESKLVPAIKAGNKAEAEKLATENKANLEKAKNALNMLRTE